MKAPSNRAIKAYARSIKQAKARKDMAISLYNAEVRPLLVARGLSDKDITWLERSRKAI